MDQKRLCAPQIFSRAKKHRPIVDASTFGSTSSLNDAFTINGMFTIIFSSMPTDIVIAAGTSSIIDAPTHDTDSLMLEGVSTVTHTPAPDTIDDISAITSVSMLDSSSTLDTCMKIHADDATPTLASPSVCVRYIRAYVHNYIMVYVCFLFLMPFCR